MRIAFAPINKAAEVTSGANLLQVMLAHEIKIRSVCRGRGICATCSIKVRTGMSALSPATPQEKKTLSLIVGADENTRLACQCRVLGEGVTIELPQGLYVEKLEELLELIGEEAVSDYLHPITGAVMIPRTKIITRSQLQNFKNLQEEVNKVNQ
ncbi:MAG: 2Fe-2S iron-sulfur cluster-binding protein [Fimbriiglobus sp.]